MSFSSKIKSNKLFCSVAATICGLALTATAALADLTLYYTGGPFTQTNLPAGSVGDNITGTMVIKASPGDTVTLGTDGTSNYMTTYDFKSGPVDLNPTNSTVYAFPTLKLVDGQPTEWNILFLSDSFGIGLRKYPDGTGFDAINIFNSGSYGLNPGTFSPAPSSNVPLLPSALYVLSGFIGMGAYAGGKRRAERRAPSSQTGGPNPQHSFPQRRFG